MRKVVCLPSSVASKLRTIFLCHLHYHCIMAWVEVVSLHIEMCYAVLLFSVVFVFVFFFHLIRSSCHFLKSCAISGRERSRVREMMSSLSVRYSVQILIVFIEMTSKSFRSRRLSLLYLHYFCYFCVHCIAQIAIFIIIFTGRQRLRHTDIQFIMLLECQLDRTERNERKSHMSNKKKKEKKKQ